MGPTWMHDNHGGLEMEGSLCGIGVCKMWLLIIFNGLKGRKFLAHGFGTFFFVFFLFYFPMTSAAVHVGRMSVSLG